MELEKYILQTWKTHGFKEKWLRSWKSYGISFLGPDISCCSKTGSILLVIEQKYAPKRLGFQHFLVMESLT